MRSSIHIVAVSLLILLFMYTATAKLLDMRGFLHDLHNQSFPRNISAILAWLLPAVEILVSLFLLFGRTRLAALYSALLLLLIFTGYTTAVLLHAFARVPCSCGGVIRSLTWPQHLLFNVFFCGVAYTGIKTVPKIFHARENRTNRKPV